MTKTKYEVWKNGKVTTMYVTEKRNAEDMLQRIIELHQTFDEFGNPAYMKVCQVIDGERRTIYTPRNNKFWTENLVVS